MDTPHKPHFIRPCTFIWLALMLLTGSTYAIGEAGLGGLAIMLIVLGTAALKVQMVANYFMGLRRTRWLWRGIVLGWLLLVTGLITIAYLTTVK
ncbi:MAG: cytochrome C oxidase subunit IV family protein [Sulfuricella sp.]|jgi:ABC-type nickel/cobalt efflux system permease component RcnA|nr:cytochrome C oxidase subunit IV family protein [Sulfuricella sp.]